MMRFARSRNLSRARPGGDPLAHELAALARRHGLTGCVLLVSTAGGFAAAAHGRDADIAGAMARLGERIRTDIDDGRYDGVVGTPETSS